MKAQIATEPSPADTIPFNQPYMAGTELGYIAQAHAQGRLSGDGPFTAKCHALLQQLTGSPKALLTHSCTAALEMAAMLLDVQPGDEIIMPSYTFVSTANAFVLRGAVPVFVDIRPDTLNLDERLIEAAITPRTRAIVPVHYAGVGCEMDRIMEIAAQHKLAVVEDAAQGFMARYQGRKLGTIGSFGAYSFHETKNIISGEGGALLVNDPHYALDAEIIREKGTDRSRFMRGEVDKYTWHKSGSSYLPGELIAAFLWGQLEQAASISARRMAIWEEYHRQLAPLEGLLQRPHIPEGCAHNAHLYYVILPATVERAHVLAALKETGIHALSHYVPLHSSPGGQQFARSHGTLSVTTDYAARLLRLPLWIGLDAAAQARVTDGLKAALRYK